jgi:hypothetical protein
VNAQTSGEVFGTGDVDRAGPVQDGDRAGRNPGVCQSGRHGVVAQQRAEQIDRDASVGDCGHRAGRVQLFLDEDEHACGGLP